MSKSPKRKRQVNKNSRRKRQNNRARKIVRMRILAVVIGILLLLTAAGFLLIQWFYYDSLVYKSNTAEVGTTISVYDFLKSDKVAASFAEDSDPILTNVAGTYNLRIKLGLFTHSATLTLVDTEAPVGDVHDVTLEIGQTCLAEDFFISYSDITSVTVEFATTPDFDLIGSQDITLALTDDAGNQSTYTATLTIIPEYIHVYVDINDGYIDESIFTSSDIPQDATITFVTDISEIDPTVVADHEVEVLADGETYYFQLHLIDTEAPVITGPYAKEVYMESALAYSKFVVVTDNSGDYELTVDTSDVVATVPGTYTVVYTATDASGNSTSFSMEITLLENDYTDDMVYNYSDAIVAEIITDDMTGIQKLRAIYNWVRQNIGYNDESDKGNWLKAAYLGFTTLQGDCYTYACVSQALLNSAGIDNIMVEKIPTSIRHYWNIVNIGDGWYHFDTTPRVTGATFFYVTEDELMLYSVNHYNTFNYDHTLYPTVESYEGELPTYEELYGELTTSSSDTDDTDAADETEMDTE